MVSIIIPAYNARQWLGRCLDSALGQTLADTEVIVVDDGSTDHTAQVALDRHDPRLRVVTTENGGLSRARNAGVSACRGDWVMFLDADDELAPWAAEHLLKAATQSRAELAEGRMMRGLQPDFHHAPLTFTPMDGQTALCRTLYQRGMMNSACAKIFSRRLLDCERFTPGILYEDLDFTARVYRHVSRAALVENVVYFYRDNPSSIINTFNLRRLDVLAVTEGIERMCPDEPLRSAARDRRLAANFNMLALLERHHPHGHEQEKRRCWEIIRTHRRECLLNPRVRMKNKLGILASLMGRGVFRALARKMARL